MGSAHRAPSINTNAPVTGQNGAGSWRLPQSRIIVQDMTTLRCTQKILRRLHLDPSMDDAVPTNRLGDWYANSFSIGRNQLVLCVSERTLLPVILPLRGFRTDLVHAVRWLLEGLGIASEIIASELAAMEGMPIGRTRNRAVLGSMNEMILSADLHLTDPDRIPDLRAVSFHLCTMICGQLKYDTPAEATLHLLGRGKAPKISELDDQE